MAMTTWTEELHSTKRNTNSNNYNESENKPPLSICNSFLSLELSVKFLEYAVIHLQSAAMAKQASMQLAQPFSSSGAGKLQACIMRSIQ